MMESNCVGLWLTMAVLLLAFDCANCNMQQIQKLRSNAFNLMENPQTVVESHSRSVHRIRRGVLNDAEKQEALDAHNRVRRWEGSSNMEIMTWNNDLASKADAWARTCNWTHDQNGQNLRYITGVQSLNITAGILDWYNEKPYYNYDTLGCKAGELCGHYTQVVWATSRELGCAYTNCTRLDQTNATNALFLVCDYGPVGNYVGEKPYLIGPACSNCASKSWWCNEGLCDRSCTATSDTCGCAPVCLNYGFVYSNNCSCGCSRGWHGTDCSVVCKDYDARCNSRPGQEYWPHEYCMLTDGVNASTVHEKCPAMCNLCQVLSNHSTSTKPSLLSMMAVSLSWILPYSFRSF